MAYYVSTYFNQKQWENYGSNWLRQAKTNELTPIVFGYNLDDSAYKKAKDFGFEIHELSEFYSQHKRSYYHSLLSFLKSGDRLQITIPRNIPRYFVDYKDVACEYFDVDINLSTNYILNLKEKADVMNKLFEVKNRYGGILVSDNFFTSSEFLMVYLGMLNATCEKTKVDFNEDVVFSLCVFINGYDALILN